VPDDRPAGELAAEAERIVDDLLAKHTDLVYELTADDQVTDGTTASPVLPDTARWIRDTALQGLAADPNRVEDLPPSWRPPDGYTTERLAADLAFVREQLASYRQQEADLVAALGERMRNQQEHPGPWRIERHWSAPRAAWQSDEVLSCLIRQCVNADTGEIDAGLLLERLRDCVPFTSSLGWRMGGARSKAKGLRDYGIDPDEYSEKGQGRWAVTVTYDPEGPG
jgi:hypothetical protein